MQRSSFGRYTTHNIEGPRAKLNPVTRALIFAMALVTCERPVAVPVSTHPVRDVGSAASAPPAPSATPRLEAPSLPRAVVPGTPGAPEQAVIVHFSYGGKDLKPLFDLESRLGKTIDEAGIGEFDGDEVAVD